MAITFSANAADKRMVQWWSGDTLTGWGGPNDGLDSFGAQIEGSSCVVIAARKNETLSITYTSTLTSVPTGSQLIFNTYTVLGNVLNSLSITVNDGSTGTATYNILSEFTGTTPSLNLFSFVAIAMDLEAGTLNPSVNNLSDISYNLSVQNVNIRATDNFFLDAAYVGDGVTLIGTTVGDKLFTEAQAQDISNDIHNGVLQAFEGVIFAQHDIDLDTTTGNSDKESLTFIETNNGANSYEMNGTGTAVFTGTNVQTTGTVTCTVNMSNMTSFSMTAGSMNNITTITFGSTSTINRANFNDITTFSTGTSTFTNNVLSTITTANIATAATGCSFNSITTPNVTGAITTSLFNECGEVDISTGGGTLTSCTFTNTTAAIALTVADLNDIDSLTFTGDNTSHAVDAGTISTSISRSWNHTIVSGYAGTSQTANATSTPGDSEAILVNVASGQTLTLNVAAGITPPTYRNTGPGSVLIVQSVDFVVSNLIDGSEIDIIDRDTGTQLATCETVGSSPVGEVNLTVAADPNNAGRFQATYSYSGADAPINAKIVVMNFDYQHYAQNVVLGSTDGGLLVSQIIDRNYRDPDSLTG